MERKVTLTEATPDRPGQVEGGNLVKLVGQKLGENWTAVKLGRAWCFMKDGVPAGQSTKTFWNAVVEVMDLTSLARQVPTKK